MSNNLENFINNNRQEFDREQPGEKVWKNIQADLQIKNKSIKRFWWAAAAGLILIISATFYFIKLKPAGNEAVTVKTIALPPKELTDAIDTSYTSQIYLFAKLIQIKQTELKKSQRIHPDLYQQFLNDNNKLDSSYNYLKSQLLANPNKEVLLDAMIQNLQLKFDLLNRQLQIIQQSKHKKSNNENKTI